MATMRSGPGIGRGLERVPIHWNQLIGKTTLSFNV
jgi:hypothetical protein